jgi:Fe-S-cluster-containing dehydrogenase component
MTKYKLQADVSKCIGCHSCEVACKQEFNLPVGPMPMRVLKIGPRIIKDELRTDYVPVFCKHCDDAPCIQACPEGALYKRDDGIVLVNKEKCTGCKICIDACPIKAPQFNPETNKIELCNFCAHRFDKGEQPSCVIVCPARCLYFGEPSEVDKKIREKMITS